MGCDPHPASPESFGFGGGVRRTEGVKRADPAADTSAWEREIDRLVYALYGLSPAGMITEEEIAIVEGK
jgi:hypothetical protein